MTSKERILRQIHGLPIDHLPTIGGWIGGVQVVSALAGLTTDEYLAEPLAAVVRAHRALNIDGMVGPVVHTALDQVRGGYLLEEQFLGEEPETLVAAAAAVPDAAAEVLRGFDGAAAERHYRDYFAAARERWADLVPIPNFWELGGPFPLYHEFGYIPFLSACALYPEAVGKIWWGRSLVAREKAKILCRLYRELDLVPLLFCGEDLCNNQGPMCAPAFLREHYFPLVRSILEPLVNDGIRAVCHCDGDVRPLIADFLAAGFSGFQGFQYELGVDVFALATRTPPVGEFPLIFGGLSVTRTLPFGTPDDVREEVRYLYEATGGGRGLFLFTANVTGIEVPPANIRAGYDHARSLRLAPGRAFPTRPWPAVGARHLV